MSVHAANTMTVIADLAVDIGTLRVVVLAITVAQLSGKIVADPHLTLQKAQGKTKTIKNEIEDLKAKAQALVGLSLHLSVGSLRKNIILLKITNIIEEATHVALFQAIQINRDHVQDHQTAEESTNTQERCLPRRCC